MPFTNHKAPFLLLLTAVFFITTLPAQNNKPAKIKCYFGPKPISPTVMGFCGPVSDNYRRLITKMFAFSGQRNMPLFIGNTTSSDLDFACCGYDQNGQLSIVLNEERLNAIAKATSSIQVISILAHEIGHINDRHTEFDLPTPQMELDADYYNGFWCSRNKVDNLVEICGVYHQAGVDSIHPAYEVRIKEVEAGYVDGKKPFADNTVSSLALSSAKNPEGSKQKTAATSELADKFRKSLDLVITVNPQYKEVRGIKTYSVFLNVVATEQAIATQAEIFGEVSFVRYVIDTTFKQELIKNSNKETNFEFTCTKVWGDFPITAILRFSDYSEFSVTKNFNLPK